MDQQIINRRPRHDRTFKVTLDFAGLYTFDGTVFKPSAFGATVKFGLVSYNYLQENKHLWEGGIRINISTPLNDLPATINSLFMDGDDCALSLKLLDGRNWYK